MNEDKTEKNDTKKAKAKPIKRGLRVRVLQALALRREKKDQTPRGKGKGVGDFTAPKSVRKSVRKMQADSRRKNRGK
jgi:hypothetical protein